MKSKCLEMIEIPANDYIYRVIHRIMEGDCQYDHGPKIVNTTKLLVSKYPITNNEFRRFLEDSKYIPRDTHNFLKHWENGEIPAGKGNHPVIWISRNDAKAYTTWMRGRLLYDFEWQYIAGGKEKNEYPWGNDFISDNCNCTNEIASVDAFPSGASPFGVMDMCSNTWEWLEDEVDDGMHLFTFLRGGSYFKPNHFWHTDNGPRKTNHHLKFQLLNEGHNRCGTISFRLVKEVSNHD